VISPANQPQNDDAVLGGQVTAPAGSVVLGGLDGLRRRFASDRVNQRIAALREGQTSTSVGLDFLIQGLQDSSLQVQKVAYLLLQERSELKAKKALDDYSPCALFECLATLTGHAAGITAIAIATRHFIYRPDQEILISASRDGVVKVWDLQAGEELFSVNTWSIVFAISIDADEDSFTIRTKQQVVKSWSLRTEEVLTPSQKQPRSIASVTVNEGRHLISGSRKTIKIWDLHAAREVCLLQGHSSLVTAVAVSGDRPLLVSGSEDRTVKIWGVA
jgi:WD40 repeat protein